MVVADRGGVVYCGFIRSRFPPDGASYHSNISPAPVAVNVTVPPEHTEASETWGAGSGSETVTVTAVRGLVQLLIVVCT